ncbi:hypothetical protein OIT41_20640 (plasmid) [Arthrobacter sp. YA7-1]|uniref:hypothetical protein n=1 Tax=Arthrobacter sp. YA7-1 TaxID=2987701 RepID=UPI002227A5D3|nr:hypothetical protein [Arthrobacter sp. YA7-1]UYY83675.1 hypothetical protein OIT41_20640 [Arthrobacter sp. YA7-1]
MSRRRCSETGLWILDDFRSGRRVATTHRGPLDPPERLSGDDPAGWNRYDTPGSTVYLSDTDEIAFAEVLSGYALKLGSNHPMQKDADFMGLTLEEYIKGVDDDWGNQLKRGCLPAHWRDRRNSYGLTLARAGWWVDVEHPDSIATIGAGIGKRLNHELGITQLTLGTLHGENRAATTMIAIWLREQVLDDGSRPLGIRFASKHGGGDCWAYWLRRRDDGLDGDNMTTDPGAEIPADNPALLTVARRFGIKIW